MNRFMLLEFCTTTSTCISNICFEHPVGKLVTYKSLGTKTHDTITPTNVAQLDVVIIEEKWWDKIIDIQACSILLLASQHFLVWCVLDVQIEKIINQKSPVLQNVAVLKNAENARIFADRFVDVITNKIIIEEQSVDVLTSPTHLNDTFVETVKLVSDEQLPPRFHKT